jgi:hyperosmotically inducible periplasmic protein
MSASRSSTVRLALAVAMALGSCAGAIALATSNAQAQSDEPPKAHSDNLRATVDDTATTAKVKERIATDKRLQDSQISVTTTNGIVTLTGSAPTHQAASTAEDVVASVNGVRGVDNRISAPSGLETAAAKVSNVAKNTEHRASDDWITTKVKGQILADRSVERGSDISVRTMDGVVSLTGTASSRTALDHARDIARNVKGVKSVDTSELRLASAQ